MAAIGVYTKERKVKMYQYICLAVFGGVSFIFGMFTHDIRYEEALEKNYDEYRYELMKYQSLESAFEGYNALMLYTEYKNDPKVISIYKEKLGKQT